MTDFEAKIGSLSPAKRALLERKLREQTGRIETDTVQRPQHWSSLIPFQSHGARMPFFWVHGDSTNVLLPAVLGPDQPVYGLVHQGLDGRPARYTQVETIAKHYLEELRTVRPRGPYLLGGYCFGAIVAFEMAQQLKREGERVASIFMLDPPGARQPKIPTSPWSEVDRHFRALALLGPGGKLHYVLSRSSVNVSEITDWIKAKFVKLGWRYCLWAGRLIPVSLRTPYILSIYGQATRSYKPQPYSGSVLLFKARPGSYEPPLNWVDLVTGHMEIHEQLGDHMALREEPQVRYWAMFLKESLDRAHRSVPALTSEAAWKRTG